jgi:A/G-specific adenine glycosylase
MNEAEAMRRAVAALAAALDTVPAAPFPWREEESPFLILMSEFMLMRTRADLVVDVFNGFRLLYPTPAALAAAPPEEVATLLTPLGLLKRIPFFQRAAAYINEHYPDGLPGDRKALEEIPGVGLYASDAVLAFAFDLPVVPADTNVLRWMARVTGLPMTHSSKGSAELRALLPELTPLGGRNAYRLLDFIRDVCRPRKPQCEVCPIRLYCHHGSTTLPETPPR